MKWENIPMDFFTGLPTSKGYDSIFIVMDMLTKIAHLFCVLCKENSAKDIAHVFMKVFFLYYCLPQQIICDRDLKFNSNFWRSIFEVRGMQLSFSTLYHSQIDG